MQRQKLTRLLNLFFSFGVGALFLWLALRNVDFASSLSALSHISFFWMLLFALTHLIVHWFRVMRMRLLLKPIGDISNYDCFVAGSIGTFALSVLPLRLGEFARPMMIKQLAGISLTSSLAAVAVERLIDGVVVSIMLAGALLYVSQVSYLSPVIVNATIFGLVFFTLGFVFLVLSYVKRETTLRIIAFFMRRVSKNVHDKVETSFNKFINGLKALPDKRLLTQYVIETVIYWSINATVNIYLFYAFGFNIENIFSASLIVMGLQVIGVMIPAAPAGIGPLDFFTMAALALFIPQSVVNSAGAAYTIISHLAIILAQVIFGAFFIMTGHIKFMTLLSGTEKEFKEAE